MTRGLYLLIGVVCYLIFFATFLYLIAFVGDFPFVPHTVNSGAEATLPVAILVDLALIALFGLQHSVMARKGFKAAWTRIVPAPLERSVYVLAASLALLLLIHLWLPIPGRVWVAPVNAPLTWPNSSLSTRAGLRAATWTGRNGRSRRGL